MNYQMRISFSFWAVNVAVNQQVGRSLSAGDENRAITR